ARDEFRREVLADDPAHAGDADHEGVGHGGNVGTGVGRGNRTRVSCVGPRPGWGGAAVAPPGWRRGPTRRRGTRGGTPGRRPGRIAGPCLPRPAPSRSPRTALAHRGAASS